ncbi:MAG TPA: 50S ribosomal protein L33 [Polyangiaceae bacterium]|nr:50S ribosomal protein L33 [Polyangiaceae bacterium]
MNSPRQQQERRLSIALSCSACHARNYKTTKARKDGAEALKLKKFCKTCDAHTIHEETK